MELYIVIFMAILLFWSGCLTGYIIGARPWDRNRRRII